MTSKAWWQTVSAVMVGICFALILQYVFVKSQAVLTLFALGLLIAWVMDPVLDAMERRGWKRPVAIWTVNLGIVLALVIGGALIVPRLVYQVQDAAVNWQNYSATAQAGYEYWRGEVESYVENRYPTLDAMPFLDAKVDEGIKWLSDRIPRMLQWVSQQLIASLGLLGAGVLLLLISFYFMCVIDPWRQSLRAMLPASTDTEVSRVSLQINAMLGQYLRGMVIVSVASGLAAMASLYVVSMFFGTKYALIIGIITGVTYVIPYVGPILSALSAGFFGYVTCAVGSPWIASLVSIGAMCAVNQAFDMLVTPRVVGQRVGLHPLVTLFAVLTGASLFGFTGMIIATPLAASIKIVLARWLPIKQTDFTAPPQKRRLDIDVTASLGLVGKNLVQLGKDLERITGGEKPHAAVAEAPAAIPQAPVAPQAGPAPEGQSEPEKDVDTDNA